MQFPFIAQTTNNDCGLAILQMLNQYFNQTPISNSSLREQLQTLPGQGLSLYQLKQLAPTYGFRLQAFKLTLAQFQALKIDQPLVVLVRSQQQTFHYLLIYKARNHQFLVADPACKQLTWITWTALVHKYAGYILQPQKTALLINHVSSTSSKSLLKQIFFTGWPLLILIIVIGLILAGFSLANKALISVLADLTLNSTDKAKAQILPIIAIFLVLTGFLITCKAAISRLSQVLYYRYHQQLIDQFLNRLMFCSPRLIKTWTVSDLTARFSDLQTLLGFFSQTLPQVIINTGLALITLSFMLKISWWFLIPVLGYSLISFTGTLISSWYFNQLSPILLAENVKLSQTILRLIETTAARYWQDLNPTYSQRLDQELAVALHYDYRWTKLQFFNRHFRLIVLSLTNLSVCGLGIFLVLSHECSFGTFLYLLMTTTFVYQAINNYLDLLTTKARLKQTWNRTTEILNLKQSIKQLTSISISAAQTFTIKLDDVSFDYNGKFIFKNFNLTLSGHYFLSGRSGSGKTTFLNLLCAYYQPTTGKITIKPTFNQTSRWFYYLSNQATIIGGTVYDNLFLSLTSADGLTLDLNFLDSILFKVGLSLQSPCLEQGANLSSGQCQLIAFLRLFFRPEPLLLLDEALSNLPISLAIKLLTLLQQKFPNKLIIYAGHQLALKPIFSHTINFDERIKYD